MCKFICTIDYSMFLLRNIESNIINLTCACIFEFPFINLETYYYCHYFVVAITALPAMASPQHHHDRPVELASIQAHAS